MSIALGGPIVLSLLVVTVLLLSGWRRIPEMGKSLLLGIKEMKESQEEESLSREEKK